MRLVIQGQRFIILNDFILLIKTNHGCFLILTTYLFFFGELLPSKQLIYYQIYLNTKAFANLAPNLALL